MQKIKKKNIFISLIILLIILGLGGYAYLNYFKKSSQAQNSTSLQNQPTAENSYIAFVDEIYNKIKKHYWNNITDEQLTQLYQLAATKATGQQQNIYFKDIKGLNIMVKDIIKPMPDKEKKEFVVKLSSLVLANLEPFGRSGLFTQKQAQNLQNTVSNIDPQVNLYKILEVDKNAPAAKIEQQYQAKTQNLEKVLKQKNIPKEKKEATQKQLALVKRAYKTLSNQDDRTRYNQTKIEATVDSQLISPQIFYLHIKKMSPTSFEEFQKAVKSVNDQPATLNTLILDLRGNVGGSVDLMQWFLGPFIGPGNLAYEFYHRGEYEPFKTKVGWLPALVRYKKVIVLIDNKVQSTGEVMAAALKKYNVGVLVGTKTKGWGTIERIFPLEHQISPDEKYSMFLVHSLTLRDDNQPIQGRGVDPDIDINQADWEKQLLAYFNSPAIVRAVKQVWHKQP